MALRTMNCTRLKAINCHFRSLAGDTVSPWETENGMWYFKDCVMEGGVDFYCPRDGHGQRIVNLLHMAAPLRSGMMVLVTRIQKLFW